MTGPPEFRQSDWSPHDEPVEQRSLCRDLCGSLCYAWGIGRSWQSGAIRLRLRWSVIAASLVAFMGGTASDHPFGDDGYTVAAVSAVIFVFAIGSNASGDHPWWRPPYEDWDDR